MADYTYRAFLEGNHVVTEIMRDGVPINTLRMGWADIALTPTVFIMSEGSPYVISRLFKKSHKRASKIIETLKQSEKTSG